MPKNKGLLVRPLPSSEYLNSLFVYDPETGFVTRKPRPVEWFASNRSHAVWNSRFLGKRAGCNATVNGSTRRSCRSIRIDNVLYTEHRIIFAMLGKEVPEGHVIDHENRDPWDNRLDNLRVVTHQQNSRNNNRPIGMSGYRGVHWSKKYRKWVAQNRVPGNGVKFLGHFDNKEDAAKAYMDEMERLGLDVFTSKFSSESDGGTKG